MKTTIAIVFPLQVLLSFRSHLHVAMLTLICFREESKVLSILEKLSDSSRGQCLSRLILHIQHLLSHNNWTKIPAYFQSLPQLENVKEKEFLAELKNIYKLKVNYKYLFNNFKCIILLFLIHYSLDTPDLTLFVLVRIHIRQIIPQNA